MHLYAKQKHECRSHVKRIYFLPRNFFDYVKQFSKMLQV